MHTLSKKFRITCTDAFRWSVFQQKYLRFHVKQVTYSHIGVALAVSVSLCEKLVLGPSHVHPLGPSVNLVMYCGMRSCVPVMDELGLEKRQRKDEEHKKGYMDMNITLRWFRGKERCN